MTRSRASTYLKSLSPNKTVAELYDHDEKFRRALSTLVQGFEYPDVSHLTVRAILRWRGV